MHSRASFALAACCLLFPAVLCAQPNRTSVNHATYSESNDSLELRFERRAEEMRLSIRRIDPAGFCAARTGISARAACDTLAKTAAKIVDVSQWLATGRLGNWSCSSSQYGHPIFDLLKQDSASEYTALFYVQQAGRGCVWSFVVGGEGTGMQYPLSNQQHAEQLLAILRQLVLIAR